MEVKNTTKIDIGPIESTIITASSSIHPTRNPSMDHDDDQLNVITLKEQRDEQFSFLLEDLFQQLSVKRLKEQRSTLKLRKPKLEKSGGTKTVWTNFGHYAGVMKRPENHLKEFFSSELSVSCTIAQDANDPCSKLVIHSRGRFKPSGIIKINNTYLDIFVQCSICGSMNTELTKEQGQYFKTCKDCLSKLCCQNN